MQDRLFEIKYWRQFGIIAGLWAGCTSVAAEPVPHLAENVPASSVELTPHEPAPPSPTSNPSPGGNDPTRPPIDGPGSNPGSSTDGACVYSISVSQNGTGAASAEEALSGLQGTAPACLEAMIRQQFDACRELQLNGSRLGSQNVDNCAVQAFVLGNQCSLQRHFPVSPLVAGVHCTTTATYEDGCQGCNEGVVAIDEHCNPIEATVGPEDICEGGEILWKATPISLLWEDATTTDSEFTLVPFDLDPTQSGRWYTWKGSSQAPLLVYDPQHLGSITSGAQLFGGWTFGGRHYAALTDDSSGRGNFAEASWDNGFEALATLDANRDGRISGSELAPLALWFDANRDAVSQPGEVRRLEEVGVTELYFTPDQREPRTQSWRASQGYLRTVAGKSVLGAAVDWYADSGATQAELLQRHAFHSVLQHPSEKLAAPALPPHSERPANSAASQSGQNLQGLWVWSTQEAPTEIGAVQGLFAIQDLGEDRLEGRSYLEIRFTPNSKHAAGVIKFFTLRGRKATTPSGETQLTLTLHGNESGLLESIATVSRDGRTMQGRTTVRARSEGQLRLVTYRWNATRKHS